jgi:hypothetical protein
MVRGPWDGVEPWTEPAFDEATLARLMEQRYVGHELRTLAPALEGDLAAVERLELRPVRNANDGSCTEFRRQELHELVLAGRIERRCRLIEHDDGGPVEQDSRECQPLLLAAGQYLVPGRRFADMVDQVSEADERQCPCDLAGLLGLGRQRIG